MTGMAISSRQHQVAADWTNRQRRRLWHITARAASLFISGPSAKRPLVEVHLILGGGSVNQTSNSSSLRLTVNSMVWRPACARRAMIALGLTRAASSALQRPFLRPPLSQAAPAPKMRRPGSGTDIPRCGSWRGRAARVLLSVLPSSSSRDGKPTVANAQRSACRRGSTSSNPTMSML